MTNLGDSHQDGHRASVKTKAMTNIGDSHQDGHRAGARTKAEANIGDSKTVVRTKAETDSGDSEEEPWPDLYANHRGSTQDGIHGQDIINSLTRYQCNDHGRR